MSDSLHGRALRRLPLAAVLGIAVLAAGCAEFGHRHDQGPKTALPMNGVAGIVFLRDGSPVVVDAKGEPVPTCQLPSEKGDKGTCPATTNTTLVEVTPISVVGHTGSRCRTFVIAGNIRTVCW
jgi:hypothetical protein